MASNELCECILPFSPPYNLTLLCRKVCVKSDKETLCECLVRQMSMCEAVKERP